TVSYPPQVSPGEVITLSFTARAKKNLQLEDLVFQVYTYDQGGDLRLLLSAPLVKDRRIRQGETFSKVVTVVPSSDTPRSPLIAVVAERVKVLTPYYTYVPYWWWYWNYSYPWWSYPYWIELYPVSRAGEKADSAILALTYILAPTPEYNDLEERYTDLDEKYQKLASDYSALDSRYSALEEDYREKEAETRNLTAQLNRLILELDSARMWMYLFASTTIIFAATAVLILILMRRPPQPMQMTAQEQTTGQFRPPRRRGRKTPAGSQPAPGQDIEPEGRPA
ncbi:MAG: hypothetical protein QW390_04435, partial [Candidatus Bathyarchaeia archaeon]